MRHQQRHAGVSGKRYRSENEDHCRHCVAYKDPTEFDEEDSSRRKKEGHRHRHFLNEYYLQEFSCVRSGGGDGVCCYSLTPIQCVCGGGAAEGESAKRLLTLACMHTRAEYSHHHHHRMARPLPITGSPARF